MTVERLLDEMSAAELAEWRAFYTFEPFGEEWKQTSYICTMLGNSAGGKKGGGKFKPEDFLPIKIPLRHRVQRQSPEQMLDAFRLMAAKAAKTAKPVKPLKPVKKTKDK